MTTWDSTYDKTGSQQFELSIASPKPGVSTTVRSRFTPLSWSRTWLVSTCTVCLARFVGPGYISEYISVQHFIIYSVSQNYQAGINIFQNYKEKKIMNETSKRQFFHTFYPKNHLFSLKNQSFPPNHRKNIFPRSTQPFLTYGGKHIKGGGMIFTDNMHPWYQGSVIFCEELPPRNLFQKSGEKWASKKTLNTIYGERKHSKREKNFKKYSLFLVFLRKTWSDLLVHRTDFLI